MSTEEWLSRHAHVESGASLPPGTVVGRWRIAAFIARGGAGEVYRAVSGESGGTVAALKMLHRGDDSARVRFQREIDSLSSLDHPGFPAFFDSGEYQGRLWYAMEFLQPLDLPSGDRATARLVLSVCKTVGALHARGFVHRDIKPANIMSRGGAPVLIDLGLLKESEKPVLHAGTTASIVDGHRVGVGTPGYSAPEQFTGGEISPLADIHAIGVLASKCFAGRPPRCWRQIIRRATSSLPSERYPDVASLAHAVRARHLPAVLGAAAAAAVAAAFGAAAFMPRMPRTATVSEADDMPVAMPLQQAGEALEPSSLDLQNLGAETKFHPEQPEETQPVSAPGTLYVDATRVDDDGDGLHVSSAKKTIQAAIDIAEDGGTIIVSDGIYGPIATGGKAITIQSANGAAKAIIDGGGNRTCADLGGSGADDSRRTRLIGFTLRNGRSGAGKAAAVQGGAVSRCIVTGCCGEGYGGASGINGSVVDNCLILGNRYLPGRGKSHVGGQLFEYWGGGALANCMATNCTIVFNEGYGLWDGDNFNCIAVNNTFDAYFSPGRETAPANYCRFSSLESIQVGTKFGVPIGGDGNSFGAAAFVDAEGADFRLAENSPCIDAGNGEYYGSSSDLDGNPRISGKSVDLGCYEFSGKVTAAHETGKSKLAEQQTGPAVGPEQRPEPEQAPESEQQVQAPAPERDILTDRYDESRAKLLVEEGIYAYQHGNYIRAGNNLGKALEISRDLVKRFGEKYFFILAKSEVAYAEFHHLANPDIGNITPLAYVGAGIAHLEKLPGNGSGEAKAELDRAIALQRKMLSAKGLKFVFSEKLGRRQLVSTKRKAVAKLAEDMMQIPGRGYAICKCEVTQDLWKEVMRDFIKDAKEAAREDPKYFGNFGASWSGKENPSPVKGDNLPVSNVSFGEARQFLSLLNDLPEVKFYGIEYRLPTAEEWEHACLAGGTNGFCRLADGTQITEETIGEVAWYGPNSLGKPHPVCQKKPNAFGLYDMHGNVAEWTSTPTSKYSDEMIIKGNAYGTDSAQKMRAEFSPVHFRSLGSNGLGFRLAQ